MNAKVLIFFSLLAVAVAGRRPYAYSRSRDFSDESFESSEARYNFNWAVSDEFGHQEARNEDNTKGSYYVHLPDGRLQKVSYYVDGDDGYVADVSYEGKARFPDSYESFESRESRRYG